jgi:flagellar basal-body rod protein FlgC
MGILDAMKISASGLKAQRTRMEAIATNMANAHTTRTDEGGPYRKKEVVLVPSDVAGSRGFGSILREKFEGVQVEDVVESTKQFQITYDPYHPDADAEGYVTYPNVNVMEEMGDMMAATRAYEANINVVNGAKEMFVKALEIGK